MQLSDWFISDWRLQAGVMAILALSLPFACVCLHIHYLHKCRSKRLRAIESMAGASIETMEKEIGELGIDICEDRILIDFSKLEEFTIDEVGTILTCFLPYVLAWKSGDRILASLAQQLIDQYGHGVSAIVDQARFFKANNIALSLANAFQKRFSELADQAEQKRKVEEPALVRQGFQDYFAYSEKGSLPIWLWRKFRKAFLALLAQVKKPQFQIIKQKKESAA